MPRGRSGNPSKAVAKKLRAVADADLSRGGVDLDSAARSNRPVRVERDAVRVEMRRMDRVDHAADIERLSQLPSSVSRPRMSRDRKVEAAIELMVRGYSGGHLIRMIQQQAAMNGGEILQTASVKFVISEARGVIARHVNKPVSLAVGEALETYYTIIRAALNEMVLQNNVIVRLDQSLADVSEKVRNARTNRAAVVARGEMGLADLIEWRADIQGDIARALFRKNTAIQQIMAAREKVNQLLGTRSAELASAQAGGVNPSGMVDDSDPATNVDALAELDRMIGEATKRMATLEENIIPTS